VENPAFPFCTPRCRAVDLGRWFTSGYSVPGDPAPDAIPENGGADFTEGRRPQTAAYGDESEKDAKTR